jgi:hypothetical protein
MEMLAGLIYLGVRTSEVLFWTREWTFGFQEKHLEY